MFPDERVKLVSLDRTECLEPRVLQAWKVGLGSRDRRGTLDYPEQEDPQETRGCRGSLDLRANLVCQG